MDSLDIRLLSYVQRDAKSPQSQMARVEGVSLSTINDRLRKLHESGTIKEITARIATNDVGLHVCAFVQVLIAAPADEADFVARMEVLEEVQECHCITGTFSYLLKVRVPNPESLEGFLRNKIKIIPGVARTNTMIALSTSKETSALPLSHLSPKD